MLSFHLSLTSHLQQLLQATSHPPALGLEKTLHPSHPRRSRLRPPGGLPWSLCPCLGCPCPCLGLETLHGFLGPGSPCHGLGCLHSDSESKHLSRSRPTPLARDTLTHCLPLRSIISSSKKPSQLFQVTNGPLVPLMGVPQHCGHMTATALTTMKTAMSNTVASSHMWLLNTQNVADQSKRCCGWKSHLDYNDLVKKKKETEKT